MRVNCLYRLYPQGEIQYGLYDTETGIVVNVPWQLGVFQLPDSWWSPGNYEIKKPMNMRILEYYMAYYDDCFLAIECNGICLYGCHRNGLVNVSYGDPGKAGQVACFDTPYWDAEFQILGWAKTVTNQYGHFTKLQSFAFCKKIGLIGMKGRWWNPTWDMSDCVGYSEKYEGYKDAILSGADGVVYLQNKPYAIKMNESSKSLVLL